MCLVTNNLFPRLTTKPRIVYKLVEVSALGLFSPIMRTPLYEYNELPLFPLLSDFGVVDNGYYHSFNNYDSALLFLNSVFEEVRGKMHTVVDCMIPPSTFYFENTKLDEVCSKKLIILNYRDSVIKSLGDYWKDGSIIHNINR